MKAWHKRTVILLLTLFPLLLHQSAIAQRQTVRLATYGSTSQEWVALANAFNASQDEVQVEVEVYLFGEYYDKIMVMAASGNLPDVVQTWAQYKPQWIEMGLLEDLTARCQWPLENPHFWPRKIPTVPIPHLELTLVTLYRAC